MPRDLSPRHHRIRRYRALRDLLAHSSSGVINVVKFTFSRSRIL